MLWIASYSRSTYPSSILNTFWRVGSSWFSRLINLWCLPCQVLQTVLLVKPAISHLSRNFLQTFIMFVVQIMDFAAMLTAQRSEAHEGKDSSLQLRRVLWNNHLLLCDSSTGVLHPFAPKSFYRRIFNAIHGLSHPGARPCIKLITPRFISPGVRKDVKTWCREFHPCQSSMVARQIKTPVITFQPAKRRFGSLHLVGPLPPSEGPRFFCFFWCSSAP